jgi:hypothetical protein
MNEWGNNPDTYQAVLGKDQRGSHHRVQKSPLRRSTKDNWYNFY